MSLTASDPKQALQTSQERMVDAVLCRHRLSDAQLVAHWRFDFRFGEFMNRVSGRMDYGPVECLGVTVPSDGVHPEVRVRTDEITPERPPGPVDNFGTFANRRMLDYLRGHGAASDESLQLMIVIKNSLVEGFALIHTEDPVTGEEFKAALDKQWDQVWIAR